MTAPPAPRSVWSLLRDPAFGPFLVGKTVSACGNWIQQITAAVLMFELSRSTLMVGLVSAAMFAPPLLLSLWAGALSDRFDRRRVLLIARSVSTLAAAAPAVLLAIRGSDGFGGPPVLLAFAFAMGVGMALSAPAMQAILPSLVPREDLEGALALNAASPSLGRTVGPAVGAGLLLLGGPALAFAAAAATHLVFVATLVMLRSPPRSGHGRQARLLGGLGYLRRDRQTAVLILAVAMLGFGADPVLTLTPALAEELGGGTYLVGWFALWFGLGSVLITVLFRQLRRLVSLRIACVMGFVVTAAGLTLASLPVSVPAVCAGFLIAGAGFMASMIGLNTRIQRDVPDALRGRVMALWTVAFLGSRPVTATVNGWVADVWTTTSAIQLAAALTLISALLAARRRVPPG